MGDFSRTTIDRLKHYVSVRLQQGVPLVDADWNEQDDVRRYELQACLKWFIGDGVPTGNDGFHITALADAGQRANDFLIRGGDGTSEGAGRCLVEGWEVLNERDLRYTEQPLFNNAALAAKWGVGVLPPLTTPTTGKRTDTVYLDVWEREVDAAEDAELVNPAIGVETCVRLKREWVVRVLEGATTLPSPPAGHVFSPVALLKDRSAGEAGIEPQHCQDLRQTGLNLVALANEVFARLAQLEQVLTVVPGNFIQESDSGQPFNLNFLKLAELTATRPGSYRVRIFLTNPAAGYSEPPRSGIVARVFINDVASPQSTEHSLTSVGIRVPVATETITVKAGDRIQLYGRRASASGSTSGVLGEIEVSIGNPLHPAVVKEPLT
jgi:Family of unknown function (DUF6519)